MFYSAKFLFTEQAIRTYKRDEVQIELRTMDLFVLSKYFKYPIDQEFINSLEVQKRQMLALYSKALTDKIDGWEEAIPNRIILKRLLRKMNYHVDEQALDLISEGDAFEIWGSDFSYMAACNTFLQLTTWTFNDLVHKQWPELFEREVKYTEQILESWAKLAESKEIVLNPWDDHIVAERKINPVRVIIRGKAMIPVFDSQGEFVAVIALIRFIPID